MITDYINKKPYKLSKAALEVLGIVAKKQPVTKVEIDKLRGVDSIGTINVLIDRELIRISGEKDAPGRPFFYSTTELFLETFSLNNLNEIPDINEFADAEESLNQEGEI